jgi:hypothetical protein
VAIITFALDITGQNLGRVFDSRSDRVQAMHLLYFDAKRPSLKWKTQLKQLLGFLQLDIALPIFAIFVLTILLSLNSLLSGLPQTETQHMFSQIYPLMI